MRSICSKLALQGAAVLAFLACAGLTACQEEPVNVDPQEVLEVTSVNMKQLAGFHFIYALNQPESAKKAEGVQSVEADLNAQGEMEATVQYLSSGVLINIDVVALADTHYVRFPLAQNWASLSPEESPLKNLNLAGLPVQILEQIVDPSVVGVEKRAGKKTYHITGQVSKSAIENIAGSVSTAEVFVTDLWVGVDDSLLYEVDIIGPMTTTEPPGTYRSIILSNLDVAVDIKAPQ